MKEYSINHWWRKNRARYTDPEEEREPFAVVTNKEVLILHSQFSDDLVKELSFCALE